MLFLSFECSPLPGSAKAAEYGGAFVSCWIDGRDRAEAEALARAVIEEDGWRVETLDEAYPITRATYDDGHSPKGLEHFEQAEADGECFVVHTFPVGEEHDAG